ncbi:MAG: hypothetical protein J5797_00910 [Prevotella sp.]|nr:hypothetical protein [Prevotella sp.]
MKLKSLLSKINWLLSRINSLLSRKKSLLRVIKLSNGSDVILGKNMKDYEEL